MGLFDIFKKKEKRNALNAFMDEMQKKMFPGGKQEIAEQVKEATELFGGKYDQSKVAGTLMYMTSLMFTSGDKSADRIVKNGAMRRHDNVFSEQDALTLYRYVARQQFKKISPQNDDRMFEEFYKTIGNREGGATTDVIPGAYGEYGLCVTNPIPVRGIPANEVYLSQLRLLSGEEITWRRRGSTTAPNITEMIDVYEITTKSGVKVCDIYISPYQNTISNKAPRGFIIV